MAVYSFKRVTLTINGRLLTGAADGDDTIQVEQNVEAVTPVTGVQGDTIHSQTGDRSATMTVKLQHTSDMHKFLTETWAAARDGNLQEFDLEITDRDSNEGGTGIGCVVKKAPNLQKGMNAQPSEWMIAIGDWTPNIPSGSST